MHKKLFALVSILTVQYYGPIFGVSDVHAVASPITSNKLQSFYQAYSETLAGDQGLVVKDGKVVFRDSVTKGSQFRCFPGTVAALIKTIPKNSLVVQSLEKFQTLSSFLKFLQNNKNDDSLYTEELKIIRNAFYAIISRNRGDCWQGCVNQIKKNRKALQLALQQGDIKKIEKALNKPLSIFQIKDVFSQRYGK
jgi:hypothetical protein